MELYEAIGHIVTQYDKELISKEILVNYLADFHAFEIKATRRILQTFLQLGYGTEILQLDMDDAPDKLLKIQQFSNELVKNQGFQKEQVAYVIDSVIYALNWIDTPPSPPSCENHLEWSPINKEFQVDGCRFTMVFVKGGSFNMGATPEQGLFAAFDEKPSVEVNIDDFYIGQTLVTQKMWKTIMNDNPSHFQGDDLPVERVSWDECGAFINILNAKLKLNFRLPSEAEWEYAARGGVNSKHFKYAGTDDSSLADYVWFKDSSNGSTHEVKLKQPNELGIYDMCGNVSEWCSDWYFNSYASNNSKNNPTGPATGIAKVYRGGSWNDKDIVCRVSKRAFMNPTYRNKQVGFRIVLSNQISSKK